MKKADTVTFKVDPKLIALLQSTPHRSEIIRRAILNATEHVCHLCSGPGVLSPAMKKCWDKFAEKHEIKKCSENDEIELVCNVEADN